MMQSWDGVSIWDFELGNSGYVITHSEGPNVKRVPYRIPTMVVTDN